MAQIQQTGTFCKRYNFRRLFCDEKAFSSSLDAILFLLLISVSAVILMPTFAADEQYRSASYTSAQEMDSCLINSIMSSNCDEFEYCLEPRELAGIDMNLSEKSIIEDTEKTIFTKEQHHRMFSDLVAEGLVLGLYEKNNGTKKVLNPMTQMQGIEAEKQIEAHLERTIGQRYNYRFEAHWQPVSGYAVQSDIIIGDEAPVNAVKQKARISLPVTYSLTREEIGAPFTEDSIDAAIGSSDPARDLHEMFNSSIETASSGSSCVITEIVFPYDYIFSTFDTDVVVSGEQLACIVGPDDSTYINPVLQSTFACINYTVSDLYGLDIELNQENQSMDLHLAEKINESLTDYNAKQISYYIMACKGDEINRTVALMCNATDNSTRYELADKQLDGIYRTANPGGADIVLMLW